METLGALIVPGLVVLIPATLAVAILRLAGDRDGVSLAEFMAPLAAAFTEPSAREPVVPEPEPVAWQWDAAHLGPAAGEPADAPSRAPLPAASPLPHPG